MRFELTTSGLNGNGFATDVLRQPSEFHKSISCALPVELHRGLEDPIFVIKDTWNRRTQILWDTSQRSVKVRKGPKRSVKVRKGPKRSAKVRKGPQMRGRSAGAERRLVYTLGTDAAFKRYLVFASEKIGKNHPVVESILRTTDACSTALDTIRSIRESDRAPTMTALLYAFSRIAHRPGLSAKDIATRHKALTMLADVCKTPTQLFMFLKFGNSWGTMKKAAVCAWYTEKSADHLAFLVTKYRAREGWTHLKVLRLVHIRISDLPEDKQAVMRYIHSGAVQMPYLQAVETIRHATSPCIAAAAISANTLAMGPSIVVEHIPRNLLSSKAIWGLILDTVGITCMVRSLSKLTRIGMFDDVDYVTMVSSKLTNASILAAARMHPMNILVAWRVYTSSKSKRGLSTWQPNASISRALEEAFYMSFKHVEPTNLRLMYALDISGSMSYQSTKVGLTCFEAMIAMVMTLVRTEPRCTCMAFANGLSPYPITATSTLEDAMSVNDPGGTTDCALPMMYAAQEGLTFDAIVMFTDNEHNRIHHDPYLELKNYRRICRVPVRAVVCGMSSSKFSVFPDSDPRCLNLAGFDSNAPAHIREFLSESE